MSKRSLSDQQIVLAIRNGQEHLALTQIYKSNYESVKHFVLQHNGSTADAKDIFQDTIFVFYRNAQKPDFQLTSSIKTYLYTVAKNIWFKQLRKKKKLPVNTLTEETENKIVDNASEGVEIANRQEQIMMEAIEEMGNPCKMLLFQYYFYKKSMKEIAEIMDYTNAANARNQKYKCMKRLQNIVLQRLKI